jgi:hypothetical protein
MRGACASLVIITSTSTTILGPDEGYTRPTFGPSCVYQDITFKRTRYSLEVRLVQQVHLVNCHEHQLVIDTSLGFGLAEH